MIKKHYIYIDYLKVIGLLCIILAHICKDPIVMQLRSFDVPLMVIVSGFLALDSFKRSKKGNNFLLRYYWKRFSRLVLPTWIFLSFYFILVFCFYNTGFINFNYDYSTILDSFLLINGIGYVWIIRVYLICALLTPIIYYIHNTVKSKWHKLVLVLILYILYEFLVFYGFDDVNLIFKFIAYAISYGTIYILGMISKKTDSKSDIKISFIFLMIFIISLISVYISYNGFQLTATMKYPPTIYYISYALFMSFLLMAIFKKINLKNNKIIEFCSRSSLWIYLWHILFVKAIPVLFGNLNWIIYYFIVVICSITITYIQNKVLDTLDNRNINNNILKVFRG